jgi:hypothetical protein
MARYSFEELAVGVPAPPGCLGLATRAYWIKNFPFAPAVELAERATGRDYGAGLARSAGARPVRGRVRLTWSWAESGGEIEGSQVGT